MAKQGSSGQTPGPGRELAPAVTPLIIGFTLLLIVISVLGYLSVRRVDEVGYQVLDLEHVQAARANLLLQLRLALTRLDNEARARQDAEASKLKPPFDFPLRTAREEMNKFMPALERPSLSQDPKWNQFRRDLEAYVAITVDARRYSLEGFSKFHVVDAELNELFTDSASEQTEVFQKSEAIQQHAARSIRLWSRDCLVGRNSGGHRNDLGSAATLPADATKHGRSAARTKFQQSNAGRNGERRGRHRSATIAFAAPTGPSSIFFREPALALSCAKTSRPTTP